MFLQVAFDGLEGVGIMVVCCPGLCDVDRRGMDCKEWCHWGRSPKKVSRDEGVPGKTCVVVETGICP